MRQDLVEIVCIIDRSGSMRSIQEDAIGGFNTFLAEQQGLPGNANITVVLFDDKYDILHNNVNVKDIQPLDQNTYVPRGMTALLDAVGRTVDSIGLRLSQTPECDRPSKVIVSIITDGQENSSKEYTAERVKEMIEHQTNTYSWVFMFLAANLDATEEAAKIGISMDKTLNFLSNAESTRGMTKSLSMAYCSYRLGASDFDLKSME